MIGLWNSEEQGLNGSKASAEMHPEAIAGMQMLFNQDNSRSSAPAPGILVTRRHVEAVTPSRHGEPRAVQQIAARALAVGRSHALV